MSADAAKIASMTDAMEVNIPEGEEDSMKEESMKQKPRNRIHQGEIIEGKREKKLVQRLDVQMGKPKERLKIESGRGDKLGDIARVNHHIGKLKAPQLKPLHKILYDRPGAMSSMRKNLRLFSGFTFEADSELYLKKKEKLMRFTNLQLRTICQILDLERGGKRDILVDRIIHFLMCPTNTGKPVITKRKKKKRTTTKDTKKEKKTTPKSKKPSAETKSKAIVTDSSSDDDEDEEEENKHVKKETTRVPSETDNQKKSDGDSDSSSSGKSDDLSDSDEEEDASKSKQKASGKKRPPAKKMTTKSEDVTDQTVSDDESEGDDDEDSSSKKTKKKEPAKKKIATKPLPKTKKADSSSNRSKKTPSKRKDLDDSSDDDEPLIKMIKKPPTNDQLKETVKVLLKDANFEEVTMKQFCQQVYDTYPDFDLTDKKDFIKQTVKSLIS
ncbi:protein DEK [Chanos chanos]|uniref:Protein DEK n=1 Tax=Chanos chanos TaxID=29144 RepID=A0A6J2VVF8_CHACN|nr:protein DEK-like [Chanos chanos]